MIENLKPFLPHAPLTPLWREAGLVSDGLSTLRDQSRMPSLTPPASRGRVLAVPGFLAGDSSMGLLTRYLTRAGYEIVSSGLTRNVDCSEATMSRLEVIVAEHASPEQPLAIVGHSRGGLFARVLARRHPGLIAGIVTLGSPIRDQLAIHPVLWAELAGIAMMGSAGAPNLLTVACATGPCCERFRSELASTTPLEVPSISVYSRSDGLVDWSKCIDPCADAAVEVTASHIGMLAQAATFRVVIDALAGFAPVPAWAGDPHLNPTHHIERTVTG